MITIRKTVWSTVTECYNLKVDEELAKRCEQHLRALCDTPERVPHITPTALVEVIDGYECYPQTLKFRWRVDDVDGGEAFDGSVDSMVYDWLQDELWSQPPIELDSEYQDSSDDVIVESEEPLPFQEEGDEIEHSPEGFND